MLRTALRRGNVCGKSFIAHRRVNERRGQRSDKGTTHGAGRATLFVGIGLGRVPVAIVARRFDFHFRAAIGFLWFRNERLRGDGGERDRGTERKTGEKPEYSSHGPMIPVTRFEFN